MIAVIGGGLQGACVALELAMRGRRVVVFEENVSPMEEASRWNEGKLHLGFVYAHDPSLATAHAMIAGSLCFVPHLERILGRSLSPHIAGRTFVYGVMRDSMLSAEAVGVHLTAVERLLGDHDARWWLKYGMSSPPQPVGEIPPERYFSDQYVIKAFRTPEIAVDTHAIADLVVQRLADEPLIEIRSACRIHAVRPKGTGHALEFSDGRIDGPFARVVNCSWRSLLALDASAGHPPIRPWLYRYKAAIHVQSPKPLHDVPCCTFVLGPYGDIVNLGNGAFYLSWYPACRLALSKDIELPRRPEQFDDQQAFASETLCALARIVPGLSALDRRFEANVEGGWIFAWAGTDISDIDSKLHTRHEVGPWQADRYVSVNTGKYCMAPQFASELASAIAGDA